MCIGLNIFRKFPLLCLWLPEHELQVMQKVFLRHDVIVSELMQWSFRKGDNIETYCVLYIINLMYTTHSINLLTS